MSRAARKAASEERLDLIFHALSDRTRRRVLSMLTSGPANITELAQPFDLSLPAVSKHIRVLEKAQLVDRTVDGRIHRCALAPQPLQEIEQWLVDYRTFWEDSLASLARFVEKKRKR